ncbi:MAG TPA: energy transducer TonB [Candidatus Eremiobacteraceae bacterium]|nr:energy transducer TonB [Candidatus Eremiobacteraceae bacterium]
MNAIYAGMALTVAVFTWNLPAIAASAPMPPPCKASIALAELAAIGTTHRYAEYVLFFVPAKGVKGDLTIHFTASTDAGTSTPLVVTGLQAGSSERERGEEAVIVVAPAAGLRTFAVDSIDTATGGQTCSNVSFTLSTLTYSTTFSFDDTASWVALGKPTILSLSDANFKSRIYPNYPDMAKEENIQGDVTVAVVIGEDGGVEEAWVKDSSGSADLDGAAVTAAKQSIFAAAHLPAAYGGVAVGSIYYIVYSFRLDQ